MTRPTDDGIVQPQGVPADTAAAHSWRRVAISVVVAIVLSLAATLLFGGIFPGPGPEPAASGASAPGHDCCRQTAVR